MSPTFRGTGLKNHSNFPDSPYVGNIVSVCAGDHLSFGTGERRLTTAEDAGNRLKIWKDELNADTLHWREVTTLANEFRFTVPYGKTRVYFGGLPWNELDLVPRMAHDLGMKALLYVSLFDEGWPLPPPHVRDHSYHSAGTGQALAWQSDFSREHPEYAVVNRTGTRRQWGVLSLAYPEVRAHFLARIENLIKGREWDGVFVCLRSQSRPADYADQFGFNEPVMKDYLEQHGETFELPRWRDLRGSYLTQFFRELKSCVPRVTVGAPRGDVLGHPFGNMTLDWREWKKIVDDLVINQDSSTCPARLHPLWPMHRGFGYHQDYRDGLGMQPLMQQLDEYGSVYVARQWDIRNEQSESNLSRHPATKGLVLSSFRHDLPELCRKMAG